MPSSMIYSGIPGSSNPHATGIGISIGGLFEQWSPLRLTNYTIDAYGAGTVEVLGSSSLVNSTLEMQGPNDNLLNEGLMLLQNSALDINGSLAGSGMVLVPRVFDIAGFGLDRPSRIESPTDRRYHRRMDDVRY